MIMKRSITAIELHNLAKNLYGKLYKKNISLFSNQINEYYNKGYSYIDIARTMVYVNGILHIQPNDKGLDFVSDYFYEAKAYFDEVYRRLKSGQTIDKAVSIGIIEYILSPEGADYPVDLTYYSLLLKIKQYLPNITTDIIEQIAQYNAEGHSNFHIGRALYYFFNIKKENKQNFNDISFLSEIWKEYTTYYKQLAMEDPEGVKEAKEYMIKKAKNYQNIFTIIND